MMTEESLLSNMNSMKRDAVRCNKRAAFRSEKNDVEHEKPKPLETWDEINQRHEREKKQLIEQMNKWGYYQAEAARELNMTTSQLNNYVIRNDIKWIVNLR